MKGKFSLSRFLKDTTYRQRWMRAAPRYYWTRLDKLVRRGALATVIYLGVIVLASLRSTCIGESGSEVCRANLLHFLNAAPNEQGDTLAGVFGGLAFFWIIVTVLLQGKELSAQRQELRLARRESARMAEALEAQADVFRDERDHRAEKRANATFEALLRVLAVRIDDMKHYNSVAAAPSSLGTEFGLGRIRIVSEDAHYSRSSTIAEVEDLVADFCLKAMTNPTFTSWWTDLDKVTEKIAEAHSHRDVERILSHLVAIEGDLSEADRARFKELEISAALEGWRSLRAIPQIWEDALF